jgi:hypothetical protein
MSRGLAKAKDWFRENGEPLTIDTFLARVSTAQTNSVWTLGDERDLLARYPENNAHRQFVELSDENMTTSYLAMYRKICRVRGVFPEDIIGPRVWLH